MNDTEIKTTPLDRQVEVSTGRGNTAATTKHEIALKRFTDYVEDQQREYRTLKAKLDLVSKSLATFRVKPDHPFPFTDPPISKVLIDQVDEILKGGGTNVKGLQKALGIFDIAELTRVRRALVVAGVTREIENYQGTNATFIVLSPEPAPVATAEQDPEDAVTESTEEEEQRTSMEPAPVKPSTTKPTTKK